LLDLTREADDTSLGQDLLEEVAPREGSTASATVAEGEPADAGALFETTAAESDVGAVTPAVLLAAEPFDDTWSGISGGVALGMIAVLALTLVLTIFGLAEAPALGLTQQIGANFWMWVGGGAALLVLAAIIGMFIGKRS
jgi:hypothetical protein